MKNIYIFSVTDGQNSNYVLLTLTVLFFRHLHCACVVKFHEMRDRERGAELLHAADGLKIGGKNTGLWSTHGMTSATWFWLARKRPSASKTFGIRFYLKKYIIKVNWRHKWIRDWLSVWRRFCCMCIIIINSRHNSCLDVSCLKFTKYDWKKKRKYCTAAIII